MSQSGHCGSRSGSQEKLNGEKFTVTLVGAAGGIGQPLSLLLQANPLIKQLNLFDVANTIGIATDLTDTDYQATVTGYSGVDKMKQSLIGADIVVSVAGVTIKPGQTRDDVFPINARIIKGLAEAIADACPNALVAVVSNPVNSLVPLIVEVMKTKKVSGAERRVFGVCTLDVIRTCNLAAKHMHKEKSEMVVPVIGGHAGITIIPVVSQAKPPVHFASHKERDAFRTSVQEAAVKVLNAKEGKGTATLSMARAAARFTNSLLRALCGHEVVECTYVKSNVTSAAYFSNRIQIGKHGVDKNLGLGKLNEDEETRVRACLPELEASIQKGEEAAHK